MDEYSILTNRRRVAIALVHSLIFLLIAMHSSLSPPKMSLLYSLQHSAARSAMAMLAVYMVVTGVLLQLTRISACAKEKLYFGFCGSSAGMGLLRLLVGDPALHGGQHLRVLMLGAAVVTGCWIWRTHAALPSIE